MELGKAVGLRSTGLLNTSPHSHIKMRQETVGVRLKKVDVTLSLFKTSVKHEQIKCKTQTSLLLQIEMFFFPDTFLYGTKVDAFKLNFRHFIEMTNYIIFHFFMNE